MVEWLVGLAEPEGAELGSGDSLPGNETTDTVYVANGGDNTVSVIGREADVDAWQVAPDGVAGGRTRRLRWDPRGDSFYSAYAPRRPRGAC
jgi:hypothetical protein